MDSKLKVFVLGLVLLASPALAEHTSVPSAGLNSTQIVTLIDANACELDGCTMTAPILGSTGTNSLPSYSFSGASNTGMYKGSGETIGFSAGGNWMVSVDGGLLMRNNQQYKWSSGTAPTDSPDTGLARVAAGVVRVSDGSSGVGQTLTRVRIVAITGSGTPGATDSGTVYTNEGDADGAAVTLPNDPSYGQVFEFAIVVAQAFAISCSSGETIKDGTSSGTTITADAIGEGLRLVAITSGSGAIWAVMSKTGTWTIS